MKRLLKFILPIIIIISILFNDIYASADMWFTFTPSYTFDVRGYGGSVGTTAGNNGYQVFLSVDGYESEVQSGNGQLLYDSVFLNMNITKINDGNYVKITYNVTNQSSKTKTIGIATLGMIQINGLHAADIHRIKNSNGVTRGVSMTGNGKTLNFIGRKTYGVTDVDTFWFGPDADRYISKWTEGTLEYSLNTPPSIAWSWKNRTIQPNQTLTFSVLIGLGEVNAPPELTLTTPSNTYKYNETVNLSGTVRDIDSSDTVKIFYSIDGSTAVQYGTTYSPRGGSVPFTIPITLPSNISGGGHTIKIWSVDNHGNMSQDIDYTFNVIVDLLPPTITFTQSPASSTWTRNNVTITVTATDPAGVKNIIKPGNATVNSSSTTHIVSSNGTYTFKATDNFGNQSTKSITISNIDKTVPTLNLSVPSGYRKDTVPITVTSSDGQSGIATITLPNGNTVNSSSTTYNATANSTYTFTVTDKAGNATTKSIVVSTVDSTVPGLTITQSPTAGTWTRGNVTLTATATDTQSGVKNITKPDNTAVTAASATHTVTENGTYTFKSSDNVGNIVTKSIEITNIDNTRTALSGSIS